MPNKFSRVATIRPDQFELSECHGQDIEPQLRAVPVPRVRRRYLQGEDITQRIYQYVPFSSCNLLTRIITTNSGGGQLSERFDYR